MAAARPGQSEFENLPVAGKVFILIVILTLLTGGYYAMFYLDIKDQTQAARGQQNALEQQLAEARQRQKEYLARREEVVGREALDRQNLRILPEKSEIPGLLDDLNRLAELSGLTTERIQIMSEEPADLYVKVPVRLQMRGQYHQLAKFFYNVSRLERAVSMEDISLQEPLTTPENVTLAVSVRATTFRRSEAAGGGKGGKG